MKISTCILAVLVVLSLVSCSSSKETKKEKKSEYVTTESGLKYRDIKIGAGQEVQKGQEVFVHYVGTLEDGTKFDSSRDRGKPFSFKLGAGNVIAGWDEGVQGMRVGGIRQLIVPPDLGYGSRSVGKIPANATLIFEVEVLEVK